MFDVAAVTLPVEYALLTTPADVVMLPIKPPSFKPDDKTDPVAYTLLTVALDALPIRPPAYPLVPALTLPDAKEFVVDPPC